MPLSPLTAIFVAVGFCSWLCWKSLYRLLWESERSCKFQLICSLHRRSQTRFSPSHVHCTCSNYCFHVFSRLVMDLNQRFFRGGRPHIATFDIKLRFFTGWYFLKGRTFVNGVSTRKIVHLAAFNSDPNISSKQSNGKVRCCDYCNLVEAQKAECLRVQRKPNRCWRNSMQSEQSQPQSLGCI